MKRWISLGFLGLVALLSLGLALSWAPDVSPELLKARWASEPSRFLSVQGMQVHLRDEGPRDDPTPIVLIHGTSASLHTWEGWSTALRERRRVIRFDLPGFALTGPNPENDYANARFVAFVRAMVDRLGVQRFVIGGNSLGGEIAWSVAAAMPDRVERLILVDAAGYPFESLKTPQSVPLGFRIAANPWLRWGTQHFLTRDLVERSVRNVYGDPSKVTSDLVDLYRDMTLRAGNRAALGRRMDQRGTVQPEQIATLRLPTLILWGQEDRLLPLEMGERFAREIPGSKLVVFPKLGHVPQEEDPIATVREVEAFLGLRTPG